MLDLKDSDTLVSQLILKVELLKFKLGTCKIYGEAYVNEKLVANSELMATVVDRRS